MSSKKPSSSSNNNNNNNNLTPSQEEKVTAVTTFTSCTRSQAIETLSRMAWNVAQAANEICEEGIEQDDDDDEEDDDDDDDDDVTYHHQPQQDEQKIHQWFNEFKEHDSDNIEINGMVKFCDALAIDAETDSVILIIAYYMKAQRMMRFTREEFLLGCQTLNVSSTNELKSKLPTLRLQLLNDEEFYLDVYTFTYKFALEPGQKVLLKDIAIALWRVLLPTSFIRMNLFLVFMEKRQDLKGVGKDLWNQVLRFAKTVDGDLKNYEVDSFWPTILDDFVNSVRPDFDKV
jgi:DCN1-like protein 1/2